MRADDLRLASLVAVITLIQAGLVEFFEWEPWDAIIKVCEGSLGFVWLGIGLVLFVADDRGATWAAYTREIRPLIEWMKRRLRRNRRR